MLKKIKGIGTQVTTLAGEAVDGVATSVKAGAGALASAAGAAASALSEKAIRSAVEQMRTVLQIAVDDLTRRPVSAQPVTLTACVDIGVTALHLQVVLPGSSSTALSDAAGDVQKPGGDPPGAGAVGDG